jgi:hypothetical protein
LLCLFRSSFLPIFSLATNRCLYVHSDLEKLKTLLRHIHIQCLSLRLSLLHLYCFLSFTFLSLLSSSTVSLRFVAETLSNTLLIQLRCQYSRAHLHLVAITPGQRTEYLRHCPPHNHQHQTIVRARGSHVSPPAPKRLLQHQYHKDIQHKPIRQLHGHIPPSHTPPPQRFRVTFILQPSV